MKNKKQKRLRFNIFGSKRQKPFILVASVLTFVILSITIFNYVSHTITAPPKVVYLPSDRHITRQVSTIGPYNNEGPQPLQVQNIPLQYGISVGDSLSNLSDNDLDSELRDIKSLGVNWIRLDLSWEYAQPKNDSSYDWLWFDRVVAATNKAGINVLPIIGYTPTWARLPTCSKSDKCAPRDYEKFATFAKAASSRYAKQGIHTWEIWNEPNLAGFWEPAPTAAGYTELLMLSSVAIKSADPRAVVISGSLAPVDNQPGSVPSLDFLNGMYNSGAKDYFDAVGYHPYSYPVTPSQIRDWSGWSMLGELSTSITSIMSANGDGDKQIWITEYGAPTNGPGHVASSEGYNILTHPDHVTEELQAIMATDSVTRARRDPNIASLFWYTYKDRSFKTDDNENFFGILRANGTKKPVYDSLKSAITEKT